MDVEGVRETPIAWRFDGFGRWVSVLRNEHGGVSISLSDPGVSLTPGATESLLRWMYQAAQISSASCWICEASSEPRPLGETPDGGWEKRDFADRMGFGYLCPFCAAASSDLLSVERPGDEPLRKEEQ